MQVSSPKYNGIPLLVHWLGARREECYSLVPPEEFVQHTDTSAELWQLHLAAEQKQMDFQTLDEKEKYLVHSMGVLKREIRKQPSLPRGDGQLEFQESHDLLTLADWEDVLFCNVNSEEEDQRSFVLSHFKTVCSGFGQAIDPRIGHDIIRYWNVVTKDIGHMPIIGISQIVQPNSFGWHVYNADPTAGRFSCVDFQINRVFVGRCLVLPVVVLVHVLVSLHNNTIVAWRNIVLLGDQWWYPFVRGADFVVAYQFGVQPQTTVGSKTQRGNIGGIRSSTQLVHRSKIGFIHIFCTLVLVCFGQGLPLLSVLVPGFFPLWSVIHDHFLSLINVSQRNVFQRQTDLVTDIFQKDWILSQPFRLVRNKVLGRRPLQADIGHIGIVINVVHHGPVGRQQDGRIGMAKTVIDDQVQSFVNTGGTSHIVVFNRVQAVTVQPHVNEGCKAHHGVGRQIPSRKGTPPGLWYCRQARS
mmetsp:Transcript_8005/g.22250  ORF Transcript_8005/g.22250 Transcript_8005/m.22250 type:complete len:469 (+) Transcript_8005:352-1758(+)